MCHEYQWNHVCAFRCGRCNGHGFVFHVVKDNSIDYMCHDCGKDFDIVAYCKSCKQADDEYYDSDE